MSEEEDELDEFEEQIRQQKAASAETNEIIEHGRIRKDSDGTEFEWDADKKAWFPKINADFIAEYQMNYGSNPLKLDPPKPAQPPPEVSTDPSAYWKYYYSDGPPSTDDPNYPAWYEYFYGDPDAESDPAPKTSDPAYPAWYYKQCYGVEPNLDDVKYKEWADHLIKSAKSADSETDSKDGEPAEKKKKPEPKWFEMEQEHNTSVYIQGLPDDITEDEFKDLMAKCGLIAYDYEKKKLKLKLYTDKDTGEPKGDGLCTYIKRESIDLAMQLIDGATLRGSEIEVSMAEFKIKGEFDPKLRRKPKNNKAKRREKEKQAKLLDWTPDKLPDERHQSEKTVVIKNVFDPSEFDKNPAAIQEIRSDMRQECSKFGEFKKITIHDRNTEGAITVVYKEFEPADACIAALNNRWFGGRRITVTNWNGKEKFEVKETAEQEAERLRKWDEYLASGGDPNSAAGSSSNGTENKADKPTPSSTESKPSEPSEMNSKSLEVVTSSIASSS